MGRKIPVTCIIHVKNEEINLPFTLQNIKDKFGQVVVVDSDSTDKTQEIALKFGCEIISRPCNRKGLVKQRNWALDTINFKYDWCFILDGDEIIEESLFKTLAEINYENNSYIGYRMRWKVIFLDKWIKYSSFYPTWSIRLFKHKLVRYEERAVNAHPIVPDDKLGKLKEHFYNHDRRGLKFYFDRISPFSQLESKAQKKEVSMSLSEVPLSNFKTKMGQRRLLKVIFSKLPFRPFLLFIYLFILRGGIFDGPKGLIYIYLKVIQEWLTSTLMKYDEEN